MKKSILASAIALALVGNPVVWAATSTIEGQFILDQTTIAAGGRVNLALLGLDSSGKVDRFGEQQGSVIMAVVNSVKGTVVGGSATPGATPDDMATPAGGKFASTVAYVRLMQGNGKAYIDYPADASGEDTVTIFLQERIPSTGGGVEFKPIGASVVKTVQIAAASTSPLALDIAEFIPAPADSRGAASKVAKAVWELGADEVGSGISAAMTAGMAGGQFVVKAANPTAAGNVKLTLSNKNKTYEYSGQMIQGQAIITVDDKITKSTVPSSSDENYRVKATFDGETISSVDLVYPDVLKVYSTGVPRAVSATSTKSRIAKPSSGVEATMSSTAGDCQSPGSNAAFPVCQGTTVTVKLLDEYGNDTTNKDGGEIKLQVKDANEVMANTSLDVKIPAGSADGKATATTGDLIVGNNKGELLKLGNTSVVVTAVDSNNVPISTISPSQPMAIQVVNDVLLPTVHADFAAGNRIAGTEFNAFMVGVVGGDNVTKTVDPGAIMVKNTSTSEEITVNRKTDGSNIIQALFQKATSNKRYLLSDKAGVLGQVWIDASGIDRGAATKVELQNAHGEPQVAVMPGRISTDKKYTVKLPEVAFKMFDSYGNKVTPGSEDVTGTFTVTSSNGAATYQTGGANYGVPGRDLGNYHVKVTYDATGAKKFAGDDKIGVQFTKPGLGSANATIDTTIPGLQELKTIRASIETTTIPVNSEVAMTTEVLDQNGKIYVDADPAKNAVIKVEFNKADTITPTTASPAITPTVKQLKADGSWVTISSGESVNFTETKGRKVFMVEAGANVGQFSISFSDANNTAGVTETKLFNVTQSIKQCSPAPAAEGMEVCPTEDTCSDAKGVYVPNAGLKAACNAVPEVAAIPGKAATIGKNGDLRDGISATISGGVSVEAQAFSASVKVGKDKTIDFAGNIQVPAAHQGKEAVLLFAVGIEMPSDKGYSGGQGTIYKAYDGTKKSFFDIDLYADAAKWPGEVAKLTSAPQKTKFKLGKSITVDLYKGKLGDAGIEQAMFYIFFGYALEEDGMIVYNSLPIMAELTK
jgi:hypothetical protein